MTLLWRQAHGGDAGKRRLLSFIVAAAVALAGCSSTPAKATVPTTKTAPSTSSSSTTALAASGSTGSTGSTGSLPPGVTTTTSAKTPPVGSTATTTTTTAPTSPVSTVPAGPLQLTLADTGRTVPVKVGEEVELTLLEGNVQWTISTVAPSGLLASDPAPPAPAHGVVVIWTAVHAGTVTVTAEGNPACSSSGACPPFPLAFVLKLVIS